MKNLMVIALLLSVGTSALAGQGTCNTSRDFVCSTTYNLNYSSVAGPSAESVIKDEQPEPFDPAQCEASAVLYTVAGKVVVRYDQSSNSISAFVDYDGQESSLLGTTPAPGSSLMATIPAKTKGDIQSVWITCSLERD